MYWDIPARKSEVQSASKNSRTYKWKNSGVYKTICHDVGRDHQNTRQRAFDTFFHNIVLYYIIWVRWGESLRGGRRVPDDAMMTLLCDKKSSITINHRRVVFALCHCWVRLQSDFRSRNILGIGLLRSE